MTIITLRDSGRLPVETRSFAILSKLHSVALRFREAWNRRQSERLLEGLPADIRKDIGWPTSDRAQS